MADVHDHIRDWWNADAEHYDRSPGHGLSDPVQAAAWRAALRDALPDPPARVLDIGAGTGALSLLAAELGYRVTSLDLSPGMLAKAEAKAKERGLEIEIVVSPATEPPPGPFNAVIERHVIWTLPDPVAALRAWREVTPDGRLVLFEGTWGTGTLVRRGKDLAAEAINKLLRTPPDHHATYPDEVLAQLPLADSASPLPFVQAIHAAGWKGVRIKRLRDVEWATRLHEPPLLGWLEQRPRYALIADA